MNLTSGSEKQKVLYLDTFSHKTDISVSLHTQFALADRTALRLALTTVLRRKGRALDEMVDAIALLRRRASAEDRKVLDQLVSARLQLAMLTLRGPGREGAEQYRANLQELEEQAEQLAGEISLRSAEFRIQSIPITIDNVQKAMPANAALVEFLSYFPFDPRNVKREEQYGQQHYVAYVLRSTGDPLWVELGEAKPINDAVNSLRAVLRKDEAKPLSDIAQDIKPLARKADELVMQPVRRLLGSTNHIFISPDGLLNLIPFAALVDEKGRYLVERYHLAYLTAGRDLLRLQEHLPSNDGMLIVANPSYGPIGQEDIEGGTRAQGTSAANKTVDFSRVLFPPLSGTAEEAQALRDEVRMPDITILMGKQATKAAVQRVNAPKILHFATHGFFYDDMVIGSTNGREGTDSKEDTSAMRVRDPLLRSGLALAGANLHKSGNNEGILTALEVSGLNLWGTKLVVLSACETGVSEVKNGDGVYGLRRALVLAGAESQLLSLWRINDAATRDFMTDYYRRLKAGEGRSEALRQVQLNKIRQHPYFWAGFIESGEWANLDGKR